MVAAFVAGVVVVSWTVFSQRPKLRATAPVPDSLNRALRRRGILGRADTAVFAFTPDGDRDSALLVIARRRVVVAGPRHVRGYRRDSVAYALGERWTGGPRFLFILVPTRGRRDTVFTSLSPRAAWLLARDVEKLLPADSVRGRLRLHFGGTDGRRRGRTR